MGGSRGDGGGNWGGGLGCFSVNHWLNRFSAAHAANEYHMFDALFGWLLDGAFSATVGEWARADSTRVTDEPGEPA